MSSELLPKNEDIILACAFIPDADKRADVLALHAFLETLREIPQRVTESLMGEIRLRWWHEAIEEIRDGRPLRYHPLTEALKAIVARHGLDAGVLLDIVEGQMPLLDRGLDLRAALDVVDRGEGAVHRLAVRIVDAGAAPERGLQAARLTGLAALKAGGVVASGDLGETELGHLLNDVRAELGELPPVLLPLVLHAALVPDLWRGRPAGPLAKRLKLLAVYLTGRL